MGLLSSSPVGSYAYPNLNSPLQLETATRAPELKTSRCGIPGFIIIIIILTLLTRRLASRNGNKFWKIT